jgi:hypothetical protein
LVRGSRCTGIILGLLLAVLTALLLGGRAWAQDLPVMARLVYDGAPLTVGQPAHFTLEVIHPVDTVAILPALDADWSSTIEVRTQSAPTTRANGDGTLTTSQAIEAAIFAPGDFATPPVRTVVSDRSGVTVNAVAAPVPLTVDSVLTAEDVEPRDIKPQARLGWLWIALGWIAGALLVVLLAAWPVRRILQRRHVLRNRTALKRVLDELTAIGASHFPENGQYKEMYLAVSHSVRSHLEREFGVDAHERTTSEMRSALRGLPLGQEIPRRLLTLFSESDLVKFAQVTPTPASAEALLVEARALSVAISKAHAADVARRAQMQANTGAPAANQSGAVR